MTHRDLDKLEALAKAATERTLCEECCQDYADWPGVALELIAVVRQWAEAARLSEADAHKAQMARDDARAEMERSCKPNGCVDLAEYDDVLHKLAFATERLATIEAERDRYRADARRLRGALEKLQSLVGLLEDFTRL